MWRDIVHSWGRLLVLFLFCTACRSDTHRLQYDFESPDDLDRLQWKCGTIFSISDQYTTPGKRSLKIEMYPSDYPGLSFSRFDPDWSEADILRMDIFNPEKYTLRLSVRIDDQRNPPYRDRFNHVFHLTPGINLLAVPLHPLITSGTQRQLEITHIMNLMLFINHPKKKKTLYIDNIRLE